jgi:MYXO-CTERM domain-containing protein
LSALAIVAAAAGLLAACTDSQMPASEQTPRPLVAAAPLAPIRLGAAILDDGSGVSMSPAEWTKVLFTGPDSLRAYFLEASFGAQDLVGGVSPTILRDPGIKCFETPMLSSLRAQVDRELGGPSDIYLWYVGQRDPKCPLLTNFSGDRDIIVLGKAGCGPLVYTMGPILRLAYSSSLKCAGASFLDDPSQCVSEERGNPYDPIGGSRDCRHLSAYHKVHQGYLRNCNSLKVSSSGSFILHPLEAPCNGTQVLQVPMAKTRGSMAYYLVELRAPIGFDAAVTPLKPSVLINAAPAYTFARLFERDKQIWLLDMSPDGPPGGPFDGTAHGLAQGQTFADPAGGVTITAESISATSARIRVEISGSDPAALTPASCLDGTRVAAPGPETCDDADAGTPPIDALASSADAAAGDAGALRIDAVGSGVDVAGGDHSAATADALEGSPPDIAASREVGPADGEAPPRGAEPGESTADGGAVALDVGGAPVAQAGGSSGCSCRLTSAPRSQGDRALAWVLLLAGLARHRRTRRARA